MNVKDYYKNAIQQRGFVEDESQLQAVQRLQRAYDEWMEYESWRTSLINRLFSRSQVPRGVYLWGGVGRGKSFLMDGFYLTVPVAEKERVHFHEFMHSVHRELDKLKKVADPIEELAERIAKKFRLICFDEFHVSDIADAMILYNFLKALFDRQVSFIMTSNYAPDDLYPGGLHRDRLLPAIELLKKHMDVINIDAGTDYRRLAMQQVSSYHTPLNEKSEQALHAAFDKIAEMVDEEPVISLQGRELPCVRRAGGIVWFDFPTLCGGPRSQNDYLELASRFHTVVLSDVPRMSPAMSSEARRFTWLIDVLYDRKVKLLMSAEAPPQDLYVEGMFATEFQRTASRIMEMQSAEYMQSERRQAAAIL